MNSFSGSENVKTHYVTEITCKYLMNCEAGSVYDIRRSLLLSFITVKMLDYVT